MTGDTERRRERPEEIPGHQDRDEAGGEDETGQGTSAAVPQASADCDRDHRSGETEPADSDR